MKLFRKTSLLSLLALAFVGSCASNVARADVNDLRLRVISARAGGVNFVSGDVKVRRAATADWVSLSTPDELKSGDSVRTGPTGRVEILLNPGSYFRAGGDTEFTLAEADLNKLRVELDRGSAVVEATGYREMDLSIEVAVPGAVVKLVRTGVYRLNVPTGRPAELSVAKGRAVVGGTVIKGDKFARLSGGNVEVSKLDKKWRDDFDLWSRDRGKELARANERVNRRALIEDFNRVAGSYDFIFGRNNYYDAFGFWYYNSSYRCYTFFPYNFGYGWNSPYGFNYGMGVYWRPQPDPSASWIPPTVRPAGIGGTSPSDPGYRPPSGGSNPGGGNPGGGGWSGGGNGGGNGGFTPVTPTPITPPTRAEPMERPMRERTIEPGSRPNQD